MAFLNMHMRSSRLMIEEYRSDEAEAFCETCPGTFTVEQAKEFLGNLADLRFHAPRSEFDLALRRREDLKLIGGFELKVTSVYNRQAEIGFWIHPDFRQQGYAVEATSLMLDFAFRKLHMHRVFATCRPENRGSVRTLEKCGLQQEGRIRGHFLIKGKWEDSLLYAILEDEFEKRRSDQIG